MTCLDTVAFKYSYLSFQKLRAVRVSMGKGISVAVFPAGSSTLSNKSRTQQGGFMIPLFHGGVQ
jgi:hypothetical protein